VDPPERWLADEMLGRLARYLRVLGMDTEYVRGAADDEIRRRTQADRRTLVTRDRALALGTPGALLLRRTDLPGQLRELHAFRPAMSVQPRFDRCTLCNGALLASHETPHPPAGASDSLAPGHLPTERFRCGSCGHEYWEGSHTARLRRDLERWLGSESA
jgi:uncharacterized protein with PIN domain